MASIQQSWDEVDRRVREVRRTVERATSAEEAEGAAWAGLLALGQLLMGAYFDQRASAWMTGKRYSHADRRYEIVGAEGVEIGTRFGKVAVARPVGRLVGAPRASRDLPFDREVGLAGGFTLPVVTLVARLTALMAFAASRELMKSNPSREAA
jgi:hypothetical protein